jgi:hypothetical protein
MVMADSRQPTLHRDWHYRLHGHLHVDNHNVDIGDGNGNGSDGSDGSDSDHGAATPSRPGTLLPRGRRT